MQLCRYLVVNYSSPGSDTPRLLDRCHLEVVNVGVFACFAYLSFLVLLYLRCSKKRGRAGVTAGGGCRFAGHTLRALLSLLLLLTLLVQLTAALLTPLLPLSAAAALLAWPVSQLLYASAEAAHEPRYLVMHALFWVSGGLARAASLYSSLDSHRTPGLLDLPATPLAAGVASTICYVLAVIDIVTVVCELKVLKQTGEVVSGRGGVSHNQSYRHHEGGFYSRLVFWWLFPLLRQGYCQPLEFSHLGSLPAPETAHSQHARLYQIYQQQQQEGVKQGREDTNVPRRVSLWRCYVRCYWSSFALGGLLKLLGDCASIVPSLGIAVVITYISQTPSAVPRTTNNEVTIGDLLANGYVMAAIVLLSAIAQGSLSQAGTHLVNVDGIRLRTALQALVYRKALRLRGLGREEAGSQESRSGKLINLLSEDTTEIMSCYWIGHYVWAIPLKIAVLLYLLYTKLGVSALIGAASCILTLTPLQFVIGKKMSANMKLISELGDKRLRQTNEVLQGLRLLKLCGWEDKFTERISVTRRRELTFLNKESLYLALLTFLTHMSSALVTLVTLAAYHRLDGRQGTMFSAENLFSGLALFNQLTVPLFIFPITVPRIIAACASTRRIEEFLSQPEAKPVVSTVSSGGGGGSGTPLQETRTEPKPERPTNVNESKRRSRTESGFGLCNITEQEEPGSGDGEDGEERPLEVRSEERAVSVEGAVFRWAPRDAFTLAVPHLHIPRGKLTLVIGPTGSGKSSLLSALLGEIPCDRGTVSWAPNSTIAYVSQTPWLLNSSLQDNVTFGQRLVRRRYDSIITATALQSDIDILPATDLTDIGERGINLSGGQRQRVAIARALYSTANVVIMDDPLSALDHQVALQVFSQGVQRLVTKQRRTVVLATHNVQLLPHADQVVMLDNGQVVACCCPSELERRGVSVVGTPEESAGRTARERWQLLKLVTLRQRQPAPPDSPWTTEHINPSKFVPFTRRLSKLSGSRYFTHDLLLPTDECETSEVLERRRYSPHNMYRTFPRREPPCVTRSTSLQVRGPRPRTLWSVSRQASSPIICSRNRTRSERRSSIGSVGRIRALFSFKTHRNLSTVSDSSATEHHRQLLSTSSTNSAPAVTTTTGPHQLLRMTSTVSESSDVFFDPEDSSDLAECELSGTGAGQEKREYGQIEQRVYLSYLDACGGTLGVTFLAVTVGWHGLRVATDYWLTHWTHTAQSAEESLWYLRWYGVLSAATIGLSLVSTGLGQYCGARARRRLHDNLLIGLFNCPIRFFDTTPLGRIMNRFSTDLGIIDKKIALSIQRLLQFLLLCLSAILVNCVVTPYFVFLAVPLCLLYYAVQKFYRCSSRELQRLDSLSRSPIQSHFSETLAGLETIRAFGQQERFVRNMFHKIDANTNAFLALNSCNRWLGIALDYLGAVIVFVAMLVSLVTAAVLPDQANVALIGLAINYTLLVPVYLNWVVYFLNDMEMYMGAVERVLHFATEAPEDLTSGRRLAPQRYNGIREVAAPADQECIHLIGYLPQGWPSAGEVRFDNVSLLYDTHGVHNTVIANLNLHIPAGQKIGICGRTGSGKSSLAMALFNMVTVSAGTIYIDGLDISGVPLRRLRSQLSVIPQDVIMFSGSIRENLDLRGEYSDEELWLSLEIAQMKDTISQLGGLDCTVQEGGSNLSCGQRQLLCLARAVLHRSAVLVMDEATSSLDPFTEQTLLDVAAHAFAGKTVITIAHRLAVLSRCDRVIVLEGGQVIQDGPPGELRHQTMGAFATLLRAAEDHS